MNKNLKTVFELVKKPECENGIVLVGYGVGLVIIESVVVRGIVQDCDITESKEDE
jgi:hypothetical protein